MAKHLVIVESPAKAKTVNRFLGPDYVVKASMGHVRDLPKSSLGVDIENDFSPDYRVITARKKIVTELQQEAKKAQTVLLAADPDREGEAICWHLSNILGKYNPNIYRILFHEITDKAVAAAFRDRRQIDMDKINAQQTRRILDRLVGYRISPLLWKKIGRGLSAGRVQSVALRLICEREKEIKDFNSEEFWTVTALLSASVPPDFKAALAKIDGRKKKIQNGDEAGQIVRELEGLPFKLEGVDSKTKKKKPGPPYITSTLQQDSFRLYRFPVKKTMMIAQKLYEGMEIGDRGLVGLITYMRTDSVRISEDALSQSRKYIVDNYSAEYLPPSPVVYKNKKKAQDAHEAIRPTSFDLPPDKVKPFLGKDELRIYTLIWKKFIAAQMNPAVIHETEFTISAGRYELKSKGEVMKFDGFLKLYPRQNHEESPSSQGSDDNGSHQETTGLPSISPGEILKLENLDSKQNFTQPPPRFTEGSLVKELEARGIGRPSTYVPIISTLLGRDYVGKEKGKFIPQELGIFVNDYLIKNFPDLMQFEFTAQLEERLDEISEGNLDWLKHLKSYNELLEKDLAAAEKTESIKPKGIPLEDTCPECGKTLVIKEGRFGRFKACSGYPDCKFKAGMDQKEVKPLEENCPECGSQMVVRQGRYGAFTACSNYPKCKYIKSEKKDTGISCPDCDGTLIRRKTRRGKIFYGCSRYPKCKFATWDEPVSQACPQCGRPFLLKKTSAKRKPVIHCSNSECSHEEEIDNEPEEEGESQPQ